MPDGVESVQLSAEELANEAANCASEATKLGLVMENLTMLVNYIPGVWEGEAGEKFCDIMKTKGIESVRQMRDLCDLMEKELMSASENFAATDSSVAEAFEG